MSFYIFFNSQVCLLGSFVCLFLFLTFFFFSAYIITQHKSHINALFSFTSWYTISFLKKVRNIQVTLYHCAFFSQCNTLCAFSIIFTIEFSLVQVDIKALAKVWWPYLVFYSVCSFSFKTVPVFHCQIGIKFPTLFSSTSVRLALLYSWCFH